MPDFNVRADSVNVEQIMEQIRARIREKRGVDYTEQQIRELAAVKLEKFLDPRGIRSGLLDEFRRTQPAEPLPNYAFEAETLFDSHRAPIRWIRRLLKPILKLFFNPNPLIQALHIQAKLNTHYATDHAQVEASRHALYYELIHNLVVEMTRMGIEVKNLKMQIESLAGRLEFNERRARALESVVVYKPAAEEREEPPPASLPPSGGPATPGVPEGPGQRSRRRRRRGRRGGMPAAAIMGSPGAPAAQPPMSPPEADTGAGEPAAVPHDENPASGSAPDSGHGPSALRDPQGRPEPGRGTAGSGRGGTDEE